MYTISRSFFKVFLCLSGLLICLKTSAQPLFDTVFVAKYKSDKSCAISYTFDDGVLEHFKIAYPMLEKFGFKGTFWINGNTINEGEKNGIVNKLPRISWKDLKIMSEHGHEISSHGWSHKDLLKCTSDELNIEIDRNDSVIEAKIGKRPVTFCYAGNHMNREIIKAASVNRVGTRTKQFQMGRKSTPESLMEKIQSLINSGEWCATMIHGIVTGYDPFKTDIILRDHFKYVKSYESKIWIATFRDVAAYTAEQKNIRLIIIKNNKKMIVKPILTLDKNIFKFPLTMVVRGKHKSKITVMQNRKKISVRTFPDKILFDFDPNRGEITIF
jgi:Predicted xylanase/chitin deacetylase